MQLNPTSIRRLPFAGEQLTSYMSHLVSSRGSPASEASAATSSSGPTLPPSQLSPAQAESLKEACSKVADTWYDYSRFTGKAGAASEPPPPVTYDLPDGQKVTIGAEGYQVRLHRDVFPELLAVAACLISGSWCTSPCILLLAYGTCQQLGLGEGSYSS